MSAPGGLRFADESILEEKLGVKQGCVTAYALINDKAGEVKFILDENLVKGGHEKIYFHPMVNSATTGMTPENFLKFVESTGHTPILVNLDE